MQMIMILVVISGALCSDYVIMSHCAHNKAIHIAHDGKVSVKDMAQNITMTGTPDFIETSEFKITLFAKETKMYLCFNNHWRLVGMKKLQDSCYFKESIVHGYFEFHSALNFDRRVGFTQRGKPIGPKRNFTDACYGFTKVQASEFTSTHHTSTTATGNHNGHRSNSNTSSTSNSRPRNSNSNLNNIKKSSTLHPHRTRHRHNGTRPGPKRLHHIHEQQDSHIKLKESHGTAATTVEINGTKRRRKKKKAPPNTQTNEGHQYLNPKDPEHRRIVFESEHQRHQRHQDQQDSGGVSDGFPSIQDEYSNDDASAILPDLPNNLDSSTEYFSSSSVSSSKHKTNYGKKYVSPGHGNTNRKRLTISSLSSSPSISSSGSSRVDVAPSKRGNAHHLLMSSQTTKKYYKKSHTALAGASLQSTVVESHQILNSRDPVIIDSKIASTNLGKIKSNKDKNLTRLRKRIQFGS